MGVVACPSGGTAGLAETRTGSGWLMRAGNALSTAVAPSPVITRITWARSSMRGSLYYAGDDIGLVVGQFLQVVQRIHDFQEDRFVPPVKLAMMPVAPSMLIDSSSG